MNKLPSTGTFSIFGVHYLSQGHLCRCSECVLLPAYFPNSGPQLGPEPETHQLPAWNGVLWNVWFYQQNLFPSFLCTAVIFIGIFNDCSMIFGGEKCERLSCDYKLHVKVIHVWFLCVRMLGGRLGQQKEKNNFCQFRFWLRRHNGSISANVRIFQSGSTNTAAIIIRLKVTLLRATWGRSLQRSCRCSSCVCPARPQLPRLLRRPEVHTCTCEKCELVCVAGRQLCVCVVLCLCWWKADLSQV